ncbi:hypothetical protein [Micromonospora sp. NPDC005299]|uniref:hypothetical protein n=1 Tax=Micromonospora sp. NPDC005299 TaxID=3364231 RepID=UPI0036B0EBB0
MNAGLSTPLAVLDDGQNRDTWRLPTFPRDHETPVLDEGEQVLRVVHHGVATLELCEANGNAWRQLWSTPKTVKPRV